MKFSPEFLRNFLAVVEDPTRTDVIFKVITAPEILNDDVLSILVDKIKREPKGAELIRERYEKPWKVSELATYPHNTFGYAYARHMIDNGLDADFFDRVPGDSEGAYVQLRMRQVHDIWHTLTGFTTSVPDEVGLQGFQIAQLGSRASATISSMLLLHGILFDLDEMNETCEAFARGFMIGKGAKVIAGEKFEENWHRDLEEYRRELGIIPIRPSSSIRPSMMKMNGENNLTQTV